MIHKLLFYVFGIIPKNDRLRKKLLSGKREEISLLSFMLRELNKT